MSTALMYRVICHLDAPRRYFSLTTDEVTVAVIGMMLMVASSHKALAVALCALMFTALRSLKQGNSPKYLWVLLYWHLPSFVSQWFLHPLPPSHLRVWQV